MFSAKVIAHSVCPKRVQIASLQLRYPKFIHGEFMTHRVFSRNASSSRAIPVARLIKDIEEDTARPIHWGANQKGMQADKENDAPIDNVWTMFGPMTLTPDQAWDKARDAAIEAARAFDAAGYHKQIVNRIIEPFSHINVIVTSTSWANFFALRQHKDAQPEIQELAHLMNEALDGSVPELMEYNQWHLPYVTAEEKAKHTIADCRKISVARCARVSYVTHDFKIPSYEEDIALYDRLLASQPLHASPAEHQATPDDLRDPSMSQFWGNFTGWIQYRKLLPGEYVHDER